jgi:hypothetical protein
MTKLLSVAVSLLLLSGCAIWTGGLPTSYTTKEQYPIISSIHGIKQITNSADLHEIVISYSPTKEITLNTNSTHGWRIQIKPAEKRLNGREFYILPKPARWDVKWGMVSLDKTTCVKDFVVPKGVKYINDDWGMFPEDPLGEYRIVVFLDDKLAADFSFRVIAGTKAAAATKDQGK